MKNDDEMTKLYEEALEAADQLCAEHSGMAVAAVLNTISLSLYRTVLSDEEYEEMMLTINSNSRDIKPFKQTGYVN
jgi:hypothetical protein